MKIAIIGVARSRTTVLTEKIKILYPNLECLYEFYTHNETSQISDLTNELLLKNNFIVKIVSHNAFSSNNLNDFELGQYDKIFCIERYDFFNQCCSLAFAGSTNQWHARNSSTAHKSHALKKFTLNKDIILYQAKGVGKYLEIKNYLLANHIPFVLEKDINFEIVPKNIISKNNLDYSKIFNNYNLQMHVDDAFNKCFNYTTGQHNFELFQEHLNKIL